MANTEKQLDSRTTFLPLLLAGVLVMGIVLGYTMNDQPETALIQKVDEGDYDIGRVEEVLRYIDNRYVEDTDDEKLVDKAIYAVMDELDPHSLYISPDDLEGVNNKMDGSFKGIGVESLIVNDTLVIIRTIKDGPAEANGLQSLDQLIEVNDTLVAGVGMSFDSIRTLLKREVEGKVKLKMRRNGEMKTFRVVPELIRVNSADNFVMINDTIGYIKIDQFSSNTYKEFMAGLEALIEESERRNQGKDLKHPNDLIVDLRDNPGGYLPQATKILNQLFENKDKLLVFTEGRSSSKKKYNTNGKNFFKFDKIAVLINENSASGSEIIAGAIQDQDRGLIIGRKSFGKGLVQDQYELLNGGALRLTIAKYYTPSGRLIQKEYNGLDKYNAEVYDRLESGELFRPAKIEQDSTDREFRSMIYGRKLPEGIGIIPDVFVSADSVKYTVDYYHLKALIDDFVVTESVTGGRKSDEVVDYDYKSFAVFVKDKGVKLQEKPSPRLRRIIEDEIKSYQIFLSKGDNARLANDLDYDPFIEECMSYFGGKIELSTLGQLQYVSKK